MKIKLLPSLVLIVVLSIISVTPCYADGEQGLALLGIITLLSALCQLLIFAGSIIYFFRRNENRKTRLATTILLLVFTTLSLIPLSILTEFIIEWNAYYYNRFKIEVFLPIISFILIFHRLLKRSTAKITFNIAWLLRSIFIISAIYLVVAYAKSYYVYYAQFFLFIIIMWQAYLYLHTLVTKGFTIPPYIIFAILYTIPTLVFLMALHYDTYIHIANKDRQTISEIADTMLHYYLQYCTVEMIVIVMLSLIATGIIFKFVKDKHDLKPRSLY